jgi:hypothetical protein
VKPHISGQQATEIAQQALERRPVRVVASSADESGSSAATQSSEFDQQAAPAACPKAVDRRTNNAEKTSHPVMSGPVDSLGAGDTVCAPNGCASSGLGRYSAKQLRSATTPFRGCFVSARQ